MGCRKGLCLAALLAFALVVAPAFGAAQDVAVTDDEYADDEKAFLIARKFFDSKEVVLGKNTSVVIELYNAGTSSAFDVAVQDSLAEGYELAGGSTSGKFERVAAGASVRHQYFVIPKLSGSVPGVAAKVTYRAEADTPDTQVVYSTKTVLPVLSAKDKYVQVALKLGSYLSLGTVTSVGQWLAFAYVVGAAAALLTGHYLYTTVTAQRKRAKYEKALQEVEKMR